jgi:CRP/FNR family transcriptional regulator
MQIDYNILIAYGGVARIVEKGDFIFKEGAMPNFYYQLIEGEVKLFSSNIDAKEIIQGVVLPGQSFGEPPLLIGKCYPFSAKATKATVVVKIGKEKLLHILQDYPELYGSFMQLFAERLYKKANAMQVWVCQTPEEKLLCFLEQLKDEAAQKEPIRVPYTRQQIADFTGLRVETVIRTLIKMHEDKKVKIVNHKIFF